MLPMGRTFNKSKTSFQIQVMEMTSLLARCHCLLKADKFSRRAHCTSLPVKQDGFSLVCRNSLISLYKLSSVH